MGEYGIISVWNTCSQTATIKVSLSILWIDDGGRFGIFDVGTQRGQRRIRTRGDENQRSQRQSLHEFRSIVDKATKFDELIAER